MNKGVRITVSGKVQNVGFRYYTRKTAHDMGIAGYVKNQEDGTVYIEAEASEESISLFTEWCRQGPAWARVDHLDVQEQPVQNFSGFVIR